MMTNIEVIYEVGKFAITAAASKGAKILVDEAVKQFTPENLDNTKKICVEVAKWGGATAFGAVCTKSITDKLEKGKAYVETANKIVNAVKEGSKKTEPVVKDVEDNEIVEIEDPELVEDQEDEEDFLK